MKYTRLFTFCSSLLMMLLLTNCYLFKQGVFLLHYNSEAEDIQSLLRDDDISDETRILLKQVVEIKHFAAEELGLIDNKNYSRYVEIDKNYLVDVVTACKDDSFVPFTWNFPIVGEVPYKGFYKQKDAQKLADKLKIAGYDVKIHQVDAFSTLGFFKDPIYSFMNDYSDYYLANVIFHEQTHATVFIKDEIQFNEELATFVGNEGSFLYLAERDGGSLEIRQKISAIQSDQTTFYSLIHTLYSELDHLYQESISRDDKLYRKQILIDNFKDDIRNNYDTYFRTEYYSSVPEDEINNAYILSWIRYTQDLSIFYRLFEKFERDFPEFISQVKAVEKWEGDPKDFLRSLL